MLVGEIQFGEEQTLYLTILSQFQGKQQLEHFINLGRFISWSFMLHFVIYFEGVYSSISKVFPLFWEKALVKTTSNYKDYWVHAVF